MTYTSKSARQAVTSQSHHGASTHFDLRELVHEADGILQAGDGRAGLPLVVVALHEDLVPMRQLPEPAIQDLILVKTAQHAVLLQVTRPAVVVRTHHSSNLVFSRTRPESRARA